MSLFQTVGNFSHENVEQFYFNCCKGSVKVHGKTVICFSLLSSLSLFQQNTCPD